MITITSINIKPTTKTELGNYVSIYVTVYCKLDQMATQMIQIWNDFYYSAHYILSCEASSSQIILVYTDKYAML